MTVMMQIQEQQRQKQPKPQSKSSKSKKTTQSSKGKTEKQDKQHRQQKQQKIETVKATEATKAKVTKATKLKVRKPAKNCQNKLISKKKHKENTTQIDVAAVFQRPKQKSFSKGRIFFAASFCRCRRSFSWQGCQSSNPSGTETTKDIYELKVDKSPCLNTSIFLIFLNSSNTAHEKLGIDKF